MYACKYELVYVYTHQVHRTRPQATPKAPFGPRQVSNDKGACLRVFAFGKDEDSTGHKRRACKQLTDTMCSKKVGRTGCNKLWDGEMVLVRGLESGV
jgi:hypothetical protein